MRLNTSFYVGMLLTGLIALGGLELCAQEEGNFPPKMRRMGPGSSARNRGGGSRKDITKVHVSFNPTNKKDPMLSADDIMLLEYREKQRQAAQEAERKRQEEEERKRQAEEERKRQWELTLLKDPSIVVRDKIKIAGIIDKEVLIGDKLYTIGNTYMGAKIVSVGADTVTFSYKGQRFVKKLSL